MEKIAHYEVVEVIGDGGMGTVYTARDPRFDRMVAIKVLHEQYQRDPAVVERFRNEAVIQAKLSHPNIVTVFDFVATDEVLAMVMELVKGSPLDDLIEQQGGPMPAPRIVSLLGQVLSAMDHAHGEGLVHRDLKPSNIAVQALGDEEIAKVMDFGIAKVLGSEKMRTATGATMGTLAYASPEQLRSPKDVDHRTDIYALGVILYEMASGTLPFEAESEFELMRQTVEAPPPPLRERSADIPEAFETIVARALAKEPGQRYSSCREMLEALRSVSPAAASLAPQPAPEPAAPSDAAGHEQPPKKPAPPPLVMPNADDDSLEDSREPTAQGSRSSTKKGLIALAAAAAVVIAIVLTVLIQGKLRDARDADDDRNFAEAVETGTEQPFRRYLETYGDDGRHSGDAARMLAAIENDDKAFLIARSTATIEGYRRYLARPAERLEPIEAHRREIASRLAAAEREVADDDRRFDSARSAGTAAAYRAYLEAARRGVTAGRHTAAAERAVEQLSAAPVATPQRPPEVQPPRPTLFRIVRVADDDVLNMRSAASPKAAKVGEIPPDGSGVEWRGEKVAVKGRTKTFDWYRVTYRGVTGWVNSHFLERQ